jgi:hypothetical protein
METISDVQKYALVSAAFDLQKLPTFDPAEIEEMFQAVHQMGRPGKNRQVVLTPIFQTEVEASNDFKRLQLDISQNPNGDPRIESYNEVCSHIDKLFQRYQSGSWAYASRVLRRKHVLFSLPGCKRQIIHTDYDTNCEGKYLLYTSQS